MCIYNYFYRETVGQGPQLYQTFSMHTSPVVDILLSDKSLGKISYFCFRWFSVKSHNLKDNFIKICFSFLVSVCAQQHVRTWSVTRFRGMISTFPGSTVLASFNLVDLERFQSSSTPTGINFLSKISWNHTTE